jgi:hypothetical protein
MENNSFTTQNTLLTNPVTTTNYVKWAVIILILAFLGFNIFSFLAKGTSVAAYLTQALANIIAWFTSKTVTTASAIASAVATNTVSTASNVADNVTNNAVEAAKHIEQVTEPAQKKNEDYAANETASKVGWCYIGEDRGYRSCAQVGASDKCMSGEIFPSQEICVNPTLRV